MEKILKKTKDTTVLLYWHESIGKYVIKKTLENQSKESLNLKMQEIENLKLVQDCECCIEYYDSSIKKQNSNVFNLEIITEYCEREDLDILLKERKNNNNPFTSSELFNYFESLINHFSILQKRKIAHRDIKLENIFVTKDYKLKIGDFGSATDKIKREMFTIQGTPNFLSPELHEGYQRSFSCKSIYVKHDPFRSDVFSLGLVFLYMATFNTLENTKLDERLSQCEIQEILEKISNPKIKLLISEMLQFNVKLRPDFILLEDFFQQLKDDVCCNECHKSATNEKLFCKNCNFIYHKNCIINIECRDCKQVFMTKCESCGVQLTASSKCMNGHQVCEYCKPREMRYIECKYCIGFMISDQLQSEKTLAPLTYNCVNCRNKLELYGNDECYFCSLCNLFYCRNCKQTHYYNELGLKIPSQITCKCGTICVKNIWDDVFFFCQNCFEKIYYQGIVYSGNCCICLNFNTSHSSCAFNYQATCFS